MLTVPMRLIACLLFVCTSFLTTPATEVTLGTSDGGTRTGTLLSIGVVEVNLDPGGAVAVDDVESLVPVQTESRTGPTIRVTLRNGSEIAAQQVSTDDDQLVIQPRRQDDVRIPLTDVRSIRFRRASPGTDPKWLGLFESEGRGDLIAVRREGDQIDSIRGIVLSISPAAVKVDLDGSEVDAPVENLEGIILGGSAEPEPTSAPIRVVDAYGSTWLVGSVRLDDGDDQLSLDLGSGTSHRFPIDQLKRIDWAGGSTLLATLEPAQRRFGSSLPESSSAVVTAALDAWLGPAVDQDQDLLIPAQSSLEYRVDPDVSRLVGTVRRHQQVLRGGRVKAKILCDGQPVWEQELTDSSAVGFDVPTADVSRVQLLVDDMGDGDAGDLLRWVRPRLVK
ncbi:NPCBM/NEW2 domain-containing protein [Crateriforma conspicua]|nr:NPCBM/NEW2 domain-containing protein [Crateriforma conspicua]